MTAKDCIPMCSECHDPKPEVSFKGLTFHKECFEKCLRKHVKDPVVLQGFLEVLHGQT